MRIDENRKQKIVSFLRDFRAWTIAGVFSLLFSAALLFGARLDSVENVDVRDFRLWAAWPVLTLFFSVLTRLLWLCLDVLRERNRKGETRNKITRVFEKIDRFAVPGSFFFLLLCWLPVFLAVYPGFFVYDAQDEYVQVATRVFSTHHPLVHVLLLGGIICGVHKLTDSYNLGIACYMIVQMLLVALQKRERKERGESDRGNIQKYL